MKDDQNKDSSRRKFLSFSLIGGAALLTQKVEAMTTAPEDDEKVSMLTADGRLVEVSKSILLQSENREKVRNQDILKWRDPSPKSTT